MDYVIGLPTMLRNVQEFRILDYDPLYSDIHCGIHVQLKVNIEMIRNNGKNIIHVNNCNLPGKWSVTKKVEYKAEIKESEVKE